VRPYDLVPVISWLALFGKCRDCRRAISPIYPLVETLTGLLAWILFRRLFEDPADLTTTNLIAWLVYFTFICLLVVMTYVDIRHHIIPDQTSSWSIPIGFIGCLLLQWTGFDGWPAPGWRQSLIGILAGGGFLALIALGSAFLLRREAFGWGDVKAMAMIGAFLGALPGAWVVLLAGSVLGAFLGLGHLVITGRRDYLPFAPSLATASIAYVLFGDLWVPIVFPTFAMTL